MIPRLASSKLLELSTKMPVVAIMGPRQSGKTTLAKTCFPKYTYVSLEALDIRDFATNDPRGFLTQYCSSKQGLIIDEVQHVTALLSYIQTIVDEVGSAGQFILTGSQNLLLSQNVSQSLAGRVGILTLLPLSIDELRDSHDLKNDVMQAIYYGGYPRIYVNRLNPTEWYQDYLLTYVERDVRHIQHINDLSVFRRFIQLCASRIGQVLNIASLAADAGISVTTVKAWLSVLEASYIIFLITPHFNNFGKRLIKSPKLYFYDTGLACAVLGLTQSDALNTHYLKGNLFENYIFTDLLKQSYNRGLQPRLYFWRDNHGHEVDCIIEKNGKLIPVEIKAGSTISSSYFQGIKYWQAAAGDLGSHGFVIYAGFETQYRTGMTVLSWQALDMIYERPKDA